MAHRPRHGVINLTVIDQENNTYDENIKSIMKEVLNNFNGHHDIFKTNKMVPLCCREHNGKNPPEHYISALRVQYLYLFILHFPIGAIDTVSDMEAVYGEFTEKITLLGRQINSRRRLNYIPTISRLVHISEILASTMQLWKIKWYSCFGCSTPFDKPTWRKNPVVRCLAVQQEAPVNVTAQYVGIPSECQCDSDTYHSLDDDYYIRTDSHFSSESSD